MADSIHDQWNTATAEWQGMATEFLSAWVGIDAAYDVSPQLAAVAAGISYLARMVQDSTVMAGDMITVIAETGGAGTAGLVQNLQNLQQTVLPQWGYLAAAYADTAVYNAVNTEQSAREAADAQLAQLIATVNDQTRQVDAAALGTEVLARVAGDDQVMQQVMSLLTAEMAARAAGDAASRQQAQAGDAAVYNSLESQVANVLRYAQTLPGLIDQRAAAGYDPTLRARADLLTKVLDTVVAHETGISQLVSRLATMLVDLAGVEDPVLRVAAQLILKQIIDRLGVNTALHAMVGDLIGQLLGGGPPRTLTTIMADIGTRLDSLDHSVAALAPLAPEADQMHEMGTLIFDGLLLAYFAGAVVDPVTTADDTVTALAPVTGPLLLPIRAMLGVPS